MQKGCKNGAKGGKKVALLGQAPGKKVEKGAKRGQKGGKKEENKGQKGGKKGASTEQSITNFNPKNHHFSDDFPVIFWYYIHIMLLH